MKFYTKPVVVFYEKKGCGGNARQKELLKKAGVEFEVKDILNTIWTKELLEGFFEGLSVENIFNMSALKIKNNALDIAVLSKEESIELMLKEPILIKRPLLEINQTKLCGFDIDKINALLHIAMPKPKDINECKSNTPCKSV
jgi:nitrogenase-associated protein